MSGRLPATIDPLRLAQAGARLTGELPLAGMPRLREVCRELEGAVHVDLAFDRGGDRGHARMHGRLTAALPVSCQRCLQEMVLQVSPGVSLLLRRPHDPAPETDVDVLVVAGRPMSLTAMVEDELLLALPMFPVHEPGACMPGKADVAARGP